MTIEIKQVTTKKMLKKFVAFGNDLYKNNPYAVPDMFFDEMSNLDPKKNVNYKFSDGVSFLAYKDNKIVGRINAIINHRYNEKTNIKFLRFNRFDFIDDFEVSKSLFDAAVKWGKEKGMEVANGPIGITDFDKQGLLIEGFDVDSSFIVNYNYEYYPVHYEKLGLVKDVDWVEFRVFPPKEMDPRIERLASHISERRGLKLLKFKNLKSLKPYIDKAFITYNEAFKEINGTTALDEEQIEMYVKLFIGFVNFRYVHVVVNEKDDVVGFSVIVPTLNKAARKSKGKLFPFGWYHMLSALKNTKVLDMYFIAIKPEYQGLGVNALIMHDVMKCAIEDKTLYLETGPELEDNKLIQSLWKDYEAPQTKRRRLYQKDL